MPHICIVETAYEPWAVVAAYEKAHLTSGQYGAACVFTGSMRDFNEGDAVNGMLLEHYPGMTDQHLQSIANQAMSTHSLDDVLIQHRVGQIEPGDTIVLVAVWSAHRAASFVACREIMEDLKSKAPFWKKETLAGDAATTTTATRTRWVEKNTPG